MNQNTGKFKLIIPFLDLGACGVSPVISSFNPDGKAPKELSTKTNSSNVIHRMHESRNLFGANS